MSKYLPLFMAMSGFSLLNLGCGGGTSAPTSTVAIQSPALLGTWQGTMQVNPAAATKLPPENLEHLKAMKMQMTFREDGTLQLAGETNGQPYSGVNRWEMLSSTATQVTINSIDSEGHGKPIDLMFEHADAFQMPLRTEVADLGAMKFQRVR